MKSHARLSLFAPLLGAILFALAVSASGAQAAGFGVESFFAANCKVSTCGEGAGKTPATESEVFRQAAGHPNYGITDFKVKTKQIQTVPFPAFAPEGNVKNIRVDVPPGLSTNPQATPQCSLAEFGEKEAIPGTGFFPPVACSSESVLGEQQATVVVEIPESGGLHANLTIKGTVYNLIPSFGLPAEYGVALNLGELSPELTGLVAHTLIEGGVSWNTDYHEYFTIKNVSAAIPLLESRLIFKGRIEGLKAPYTGEFLTNPSSCNPPGPATTSTVQLESYNNESSVAHFESPFGANECESVPFAPLFSTLPETTQSDSPTAVTTKLEVPRGLGLHTQDSSTLKTATVTLPEGMTLNPSATHEVTEGCTPEQIGIGTTAAVSCPAASKVGTVSIEVPTLPAGSLTGNVYLGKPASGPITGPPYTIYVDAESARFGISVRLKGSVVPNEATGRLTATFSENPEQPFSDFILHFNGGPNAPLANPLACGPASTQTTFVPFSGTPPVSPFVSPFTVDSNGSGGACASPLPFSPTQVTRNQPPGLAGAATSYAVEFERASGQQYVSHIKTTMPKGLIGLIPAVAQCGEAEANAGTCPAASQIGVVRVASGAGPTPYQFSGNAYLTGPYNGAPFGVSIVVPAVAGPFNLGNVVTRGTITIDPYTAQVTVESTLPTIVKGVPLRLRKVAVEINRQGFLKNPTNCSVLATESTLTGFVPGLAGNANALLSSPFQVNECNKLAFKPKFTASTGAKTSKANGASLTTTITQASGQANIKSVLVQLPAQLPSRLTTLQKACLAATFESNPFHCPSGSFVGGATVVTPALPNKLTGPAILVSHGGAAFPDLDLVVEDPGVRVILVGNTNIKKAITTTNFAATPDVPVSSVTVNLPTGPHSALTANGNLCASNLVMPTTITGQNGVTVKQNTKIAVSGCGVRIVGAKAIGNTAYLTVQTPAAGRISGSGSNLRTVSRNVGSAQTTSLKVPLSRSGLRKHRPFKVRVRVGFVPKKKGPTSAAFTTVTFSKAPSVTG